MSLFNAVQIQATVSERRLGGVPVKMLVWLSCCQQEASSWMLWARAQVSLFSYEFS